MLGANDFEDSFIAFIFYLLFSVVTVKISVFFFFLIFFLTDDKVQITKIRLLLLSDL